MDDRSTQSGNAFTRRVFLQQGITLASLSAAAPLFLQRSAFGMMRPLGSMVTSQAGIPEDRILVVVQLGGGNDGLNTVIPYGMGDYYDARPNLAIPEPGTTRNGAASALAIDGANGFGLHPALAGFKELLDDGKASIVQGVGYPNPNRSHFTSMDIWHTARTSGNSTGWLGRYFDNTCAGTPKPESGIAIGRTAPLAMHGDLQAPISFESADLYRWVGKDLHESVGETFDELVESNANAPEPEEDSQLNFLTKTTMDAQVSSVRIRSAVSKRPLVPYPGGSLSNQLQIVAAMIRDELPTRVYYVTLGGFDTHAGQAGAHTNLLRQVGGSLNAFYKDIKAQGNNGRVLTMVFSEFGRRVRQNGSGGTDHGTAAPMYFVGDMVRPGLLGDHPSLTDLDQGDLKFTVDFRSIYSSLLEDWMKAPASSILGKKYRKANLFA